MSDILEEVLNDQNDEKRLYYFKRILPIIIVLAIVVVLAMVINNWYEDMETKNNKRTGDLLIKAIETIDDNKELSIESLENLIATSNNRVGEIALLEQVGIKISDKDYAGAKTLLEKAIKHKEYHDLTTSYARLVWLSLVIDNPHSSEQEKIQEYLKYFDNEDKAFFGTASIIKAIWCINNGRVDSAKDVLKRILLLERTPQVVKEQAKAILSNLEQQ